MFFLQVILYQNTNKIDHWVERQIFWIANTEVHTKTYTPALFTSTEGLSVLIVFFWGRGVCVCAEEPTTFSCSLYMYKPLMKSRREKLLSVGCCFWSKYKHTVTAYKWLLNFFSESVESFYSGSGLDRMQSVTRKPRRKIKTRNWLLTDEMSLKSMAMKRNWKKEVDRAELSCLDSYSRFDYIFCLSKRIRLFFLLLLIGSFL